MAGFGLSPYGRTTQLRNQRSQVERSTGLSDQQRVAALLELSQQEDAVRAFNKANGLFGGSGGGERSRFIASQTLANRPSTISYGGTPQEMAQQDLFMRQQEASHRAALNERAQTLKSKQGRADEVWGAIVKAGSDSNNPMSQEEFQQVAEQYQTEFGGAERMPNPIQLRRANEEEDNVQLDMVNTSTALATKFGQDPDIVQAMFSPDPKTKRISTSDRARVTELLWKMSKPTAQEVNAVKTSISMLDKQLDSLQKNSMLFNPDGSEKAKPSASLFSDNADAIERYEVARRQYENLMAEKGRREQQLMSYAPQADGSQPAKTQAAPAPEPNMEGTKEAPFTMKEGDDPESVARKAQEIARRDNRVVYVKGPDGKTYPFKP